MSNLPVLWIPPIEPPSPDDRPPTPRRSRGWLLATVALLVVPLSAWALIGGGTRDQKASAPTATASSQPNVTTEGTGPTKTDAPPPAAPTAATPAPLATSPAAESPAAPTSPRTTRATETPAPAPTAAEAEKPVSSAVGAEGQGVRVIDMNKPNGGGHAVARPAVSLPNTTLQPTTRRPAAVAAPQPPVTPPASAATAPSTNSPPPPIDASAPAASTRDPTTDKKTLTRPAPVATPPKTVEPGAGASDFADRLATIRRSEETAPRVLGDPPRYLEVPPSIEDDEDTRIVTPSIPRDDRYDRPNRRRDSNWDDENRVPPAGIPEDDPPPRGALRPYDGPDRVVRSSAPRGENCHYHAYPADDMAFHRDVRCHWHEDPNDPSIHYTR